MQKTHGIMCILLLATWRQPSESWLPCALCAVPEGEIKVQFIDYKKKVVNEKCYGMDHVMLKASGYMKKAAESVKRGEDDHIKIMWDRDIFDMVDRIFSGRRLGKVSMENTIEIIHLLEYLNIERDYEAECYAHMARKTMKLFKDLTEDEWDTFIKKILEEYKGDRPRSLKVYALQLLREWAGRHGMCVAVCGEKATLCAIEYPDLYHKYGSVKEVAEFSEIKILKDDRCTTYEQHTEVFDLLRAVTDAMGIDTVDISIVGWVSGDTFVIEEIQEMDKFGRLAIECRNIEPGTMPRSFRRLRGDIEELNVSGNTQLSDSDWRTVGKMTALRKLDISFCGIEPDGILRHFDGLKGRLEVLNVSRNTRLSRRFWQAVGEMRVLKSLNVSRCEMAEGTVFAHFQKLGLEELDVSFESKLGDRDWETIGKMKALKRLNMSFCDIEPGKMSEHLQGLKEHLEVLDVSGNIKLDDTDWRTIGEMKMLRILKASRCDVAEGKISECIQMQKGQLVDLSISGNTRLNSADWKTIGEAERLRKLDVSDCEIAKEVIFMHFQGLKEHLEELCVSGNTRLDNMDWKTIGEGRALRVLEMSFCDLQPGMVSNNFEALKSHLAKLDVSGNGRLSRADCETIGKMARLERLHIGYCDLKREIVSRCLQELRGCQLTHW